jgi:hypothetical protein
MLLLPDLLLPLPNVLDHRVLDHRLDLLLPPLILLPNPPSSLLNLSDLPFLPLVIL